MPKSKHRRKPQRSSGDRSLSLASYYRPPEGVSEEDAKEFARTLALLDNPRARLSLKDTAILFDCGLERQVGKQHDDLAMRVERSYKELVRVCDDTVCPMQTPWTGYLAMHLPPVDVDVYPMSFMPFSALLGEMGEGDNAATAMLEVIESHEAILATWVAPCQSPGIPMLLLSMDKRSGQCAHLVLGDEILRLRSFESGVRLLRHRINEFRANFGEEYEENLNEIISFLLATLGVSAEVVQKNAAFIRSMLQELQMPLGHSALARAVEISRRLVNVTAAFDAERVALTADHARAEDKLRQRMQAEIERLQQLFDRATQRANANEAELRLLKRNGSATSAAKPATASLPARLDALF